MPIEGSCLTADDLPVAHIIDADAALLQLEIGDGRYEVSVAVSTPEGGLAAVVLLDDMTPDRLTALARFWAAVTNRSVPADPRISTQRRDRARLMLRVVDARAVGATYRGIAEALFPQHETYPATWVGSAVRETTIRLARDGMKLVGGGYRTLLRRPRRDR